MNKKQMDMTEGIEEFDPISDIESRKNSDEI